MYGACADSAGERWRSWCCLPLAASEHSAELGSLIEARLLESQIGGIPYWTARMRRSEAPEHSPPRHAIRAARAPITCLGTPSMVRPALAVTAANKSSTIHRFCSRLRQHEPSVSGDVHLPQCGKGFRQAISVPDHTRERAASAAWAAPVCMASNCCTGDSVVSTNRHSGGACSFRFRSVEGKPRRAWVRRQQATMLFGLRRTRFCFETSTSD